MMNASVRADVKLVELGLVRSRTQAADLIKEGHILYEGKPLKKASQLVSGSDFQVTKEKVYVGRGAHKLESAFKKFSINFKDKIVLDVGASTGGFTEFALENGAKKVFAVDVGSDQLDPTLRGHSRVVNLERTDIRNIEHFDEVPELVVVDVSFISLKHIWPALARLAPRAQMMVLVKPQFEVGAVSLGKGGVVKDKKIRHQALRDLWQSCHEVGLKVAVVSYCDVLGKSGNQEYFFWIDPMLGQGDITQIEELV